MGNARITALNGIVLKACERILPLEPDIIPLCSTAPEALDPSVTIASDVQLLSGDDLFIQGYGGVSVAAATILRAGMLADGTVNSAKNGFADTNEVAKLTVWSNDGHVNITSVDFASAGDIYLDAGGWLIRTPGELSLSAVRNLTIATGQYKHNTSEDLDVSKFTIGHGEYLIAGGELILNFEGANIVNEGLILSGTPLWCHSKKNDHLCKVLDKPPRDYLWRRSHLGKWDR